MTDEERLIQLEHRVRELQTAVVAVIRHLGIEHDLRAAERARVDELRLSGEADAPSRRLIELYSEPQT